MTVESRSRRKPFLAVLAFNAALVLAVFSVLTSACTFVADARTLGLLWGVGFALSSLALVALSMRHMPRPLRFLASGVAALAVFGGWVSASRLIA